MKTNIQLHLETTPGTGFTANLTNDQRSKLALLREKGFGGALAILDYRANHPLATLGSAIDDLYYLAEND